MNIKFFPLAVSFLMMSNVYLPNSAQAGGFKEAGASFLVPTTGQAMNGEIGATKTKIMAGIELASITAITVLGIAAGGGVVWFGLGPLLGNHLVSAVDAFQGAQYKEDPNFQSQVVDAQRTLDMSRQRRFEREQNYRSDIRDRVRRAGEVSAY